MTILPSQITAASKPQSTMKAAEQEQLRKACADFEALLTHQMLTTMRESAFENQGIFEKSYGEKLFQSLADQEIAEKMALGNGLGLGDMLFKSLTKNA